MKNSDMKLYEAFLTESPHMARNDLYYTLLEWADEHPELREEHLKKTDVFRVEYIISNNFYEKIFTQRDYKNPYTAARDFVSRKLKEYPDNFEFELRVDPNPYRVGNRMAQILLTNME